MLHALFLCSAKTQLLCCYILLSETAVFKFPAKLSGFGECLALLKLKNKVLSNKVTTWMLLSLVSLQVCSIIHSEIFVCQQKLHLYQPMNFLISPLLGRLFGVNLMTLEGV